MLEIRVGKQGWKATLESSVGKQCWEMMLGSTVGNRNTMLDIIVGKQYWDAMLATTGKQCWKPILESNVGNQYSNEYGMGQQSFHEAEQFMGQSQGNYFPSGASVMQASVMQQSFGAPEQQSLTPPPPFMGRGRSVAQNNNFMHEGRKQFRIV